MQVRILFRLQNNKQMSKQTAVEWLIIKDSQATIDFIEGKITSLELAAKKATLVEQAKAMEKEQIEDAFGDALNQYRHGCSNRSDYYKKTYGGEQ